jgi:hypothetical protein
MRAGEEEVMTDPRMWPGGCETRISGGSEAMVTYWRCAGCKEVWMEGGPGKWCESCHTDKGWEKCEVHPVGTGDELARLRELEIKVGIEKAHRWRTNEYG